MGERSNSVFISYRRETSQYLAMALWQNLTDRSVDVFYDFESIAAGHFDNIILAQIAARPYMILVLAPGALKRCTEPNDWLRREIEEALALGRVLVPVYTPEFDFDEIDRYLPEGTAEHLRRFQMLEIPPRYFKYAIAELADKLLEPIVLDLTEAPPEAAAAAAQQSSKTEEAPAVTEEALSAEEHFARGYDRQLEGDLEDAIAAYGEAIRLNADYAEVFNNRGNARREQGDFDGAVADYDEAIRLNPNYSLAFNNRGDARREQGDFDGAVADLDEAIRLNPDHAIAFYNRGLARHEQGDLDGAVADYDEAIRLNPSFSEAKANRDTALKDLGRQ